MKYCLSIKGNKAQPKTARKQNPIRYENKTYSRNGGTGDNFETEWGRKIIVIAILRDR